MNSAERPKGPRPLSPHLQIYRWPLNMGLSILHRITGAALCVGLVLVVWMLAAAMRGPDAWDVFTGFTSAPLGQLMIFGWAVALYYHAFNGIRHMIWDMGAMLSIKSSEAGGWCVLAATAIGAVLTAWGMWA